MIIATNVTKQYGKLKALDNVSVTCNKGQSISLIGPNGSGKTTFIKCLLGMVVPDSGFITFNQNNIIKDWRYREQIGYMPQTGRYPDNMTIAQLISMMKDIRKDFNPGIDEELYDAFGLDKISNKRMSSLSGGTRQKVSASLAFLFKPQVLILDEPTAGLDPVATEILKTKILKEKQQGKLILITSHILSDLEDIVSEIIYLNEGKLVFHKTIEDLKKDTGENKLARAVANVMSKTAQS
jgi:Cu-processing system ATP-binding protein